MLGFWEGKREIFPLHTFEVYGPLSKLLVEQEIANMMSVVLIYRGLGEHMVSVC